MTIRTHTAVPSDAFTDHLANCPDCAVRLDGTGPVCLAGQSAMESVDWPAVSAARDRAVFTATGSLAALLTAVLTTDKEV